MQEGWSYIKDTEDFLKKVRNMAKIPQGDSRCGRLVSKHTT